MWVNANTLTWELIGTVTWLKESGTPTAALGTERGLAIEDGSADVSPFVRALR